MKRCKPKRNYKVMTTKIRIVIRSFDHPNHESCISCYDRLILIKSPRTTWNGNQENISGHKNIKAWIAKEVFSVKTPCDSGYVRLLGQAKKIAERMLLPHHAWPFTLSYEHGGMQHGKELNKCLIQQVTLRSGGKAIDCSTRVKCA